MNQQWVPNDNAMVQEHYKSSDHLNIRIQTHEKYSQPKTDFPSWILDRITWSGTENVLDVGCGPGIYVAPALERCQWYIAGDLSPGMLGKLSASIVDRVNLDATMLPFVNNSVDAVLANHMLYHVPDLRAALLSIKRVLRKDGRLIAATNSTTYMVELDEIINNVANHFGVADFQDQSQTDFIWPFTLENGGNTLAKFFSQVERHDLDGALIFPTAEPALAYINSTKDLYQPLLPREISWPMFLGEIDLQINERIRKIGYFRVNKLNGAFVCQK